MVTQIPLPKGHSAPNFRPMLRPNGWLDQYATWYGGRLRPRRQCWICPQKGCGTAAPPDFGRCIVAKRLDGSRCIGTKLGVGPGDIVLHGNPAPPPQKKKWAQAFPNFGPCLLWPNGWIDQDVTWYVGGPRPRPHCVRWGLGIQLSQRDTAPNFRLMSIVAKRSPISATADHLLVVVRIILGRFL